MVFLILFRHSQNPCSFAFLPCFFVISYGKAAKKRLAEALHDSTADLPVVSAVRENRPHEITISALGPERQENAQEDISGAGGKSSAVGCTGQTHCAFTTPRAKLGVPRLACKPCCGFISCDSGSRQEILTWKKPSLTPAIPGVCQFGRLCSSNDSVLHDQSGRRSGHWQVGWYWRLGIHLGVCRPS